MDAFRFYRRATTGNGNGAGPHRLHAGQAEPVGRGRPGSTPGIVADTAAFLTAGTTAPSQ